MAFEWVWYGSLKGAEARASDSQSGWGSPELVTLTFSTGSRAQPLQEKHMNWDRIEGNWKQLKGRVTEQWGKLTDDDFDVVNGRREQLAGKIQERYGIAKDEAERQVASWERTATDDCTTTKAARQRAAFLLSRGRRSAL
eukprot:gene23382-43884_t